MLRVKVLVIALLSVLGFTQAYANVHKIGVLKEQTVLENSLYGKVITKRLQGFYNTKQNELNAKKEVLDKKGEVFQRDELVLSEKDRNEKKQELIKLQRDLQGMAEQYGLEIQDLEQSEKQGFYNNMLEEVKTIAKKEKLDLVIAQHLTYYNEQAIDLTGKVVQALDERYKSKNKK